VNAGAAVLAEPSVEKLRNRHSSIPRNVRVFAMRTREELVDYALRMLDRAGQTEALGVERVKLAKFVERCSQSYLPNPYHNWHHAVDVTHTMAWMLTRPVLRAQIPPVDAFWMMISAITHDLDHPGHNNQWEINIRSPLADQYANLAVLEHHSLDLAAQMMAQPEMRFTEGMSSPNIARGKQLLRDLILATDFAIHKDFLASFSAAVHDFPQRRDFRDPEFALLVMKALIKAADIANTAKPFAQAKIWGLRVMQEFWAQGRLEKAHAFPVGPLNDEERVDLNQAQAGFIRFAALELFELLARVEPGLSSLVKTLHDNVALYEAVPAKAVSTDGPRSAKN
jgi:cAMP-specific phosphodiesterase